MRRAVWNKKLLILCLVLVCVTFISGMLNLQDEGLIAEASAQTLAASLEINSPADLLQLADEVNVGLHDGYYGITITLMTDIDIGVLCTGLDEGAGWIPIGTSTYPFKGIFDGNGHCVEGLYIDREDADRIGLFGNTHFNATIKNLTVAGYVRGNNYIGGVVGYNQAKIENCINKATVVAKDGAMHLGGVVGYNAGSIVQSGNECAISVGFVNFVAGISGSNIGTIQKCYNIADVSATDSVVGGIVGNNTTEGVVEICINGGEISGKANVGGIIGSNYGLLQNAFNSGTVETVNGTAGGIVGYNDASGMLSYVLSASQVTGAEDVAAVCGYNLGIARATFYDSSIYSGALLNGLSAESSSGFSTRVLAHSDVLSAEDKLSILTESNSNTWTRSSVSEQDCFYPQLNYFYTDLPLISAQVCNLTRTELNGDDIVLGENSFVYDGEEHTVDIYYGKIKLECGQDYSASYVNNVNAGKAEITIEFLNSLSGYAVKEFAITQSVLTVEWDNESYIYDGEKHEPTVMATDGLIDGEIVTFDYTVMTAIDAGKYYIKATLADTSVNSNYSLPVTELQFEILPAVITVDWSGADFVYNGNVQRPSAFVLTGRVGDDDITFRYEGSDCINAGEQHVTVFLQDTSINKNYSFIGDTCVYTIAKRPITIEWEDRDFYYNGLVQYPTAVVSSGRINVDNISFDYFGYEKNIGANESDGYSVTVALADTIVNANYSFEPKSCVYYIRKTPITIVWWDMTLEYTGLPQYPAFYIEQGLIGEEEIIFDISDYSLNINASSGNAYIIEVTLADNIVNSNYSMNATTKTYDIAKADFDLNSVGFRSRTFGYDGEPKSIEIDCVLPIGVNVQYVNNNPVDIGEYTVTAKFAVDLDNYNPLAYDTLQAKVYIAQMIFTDSASGIIAVNKSMPDSLLQLDIISKSKSSLQESGKKVLFAYEVNFANGIAEYSVPITQKQQNSKGLAVLCKNSEGEIFVADFTIVDNMVIFSAEDVVEFAFLSNRNLLPLWVVLGVVVAVVLVVALSLGAILIKRRQSKMMEISLVSGVLPNAHVDDCEAFLVDDNTRQLETEEISEIEHNFDCGGINSKEQDINPEEASTMIKSDRVEIKDKVDFMFDGVRCISFEWFLKSLNVKTESKQERICAGDEYALQLTESKPDDVVFWKGERYRIGTVQYQDFINRAREAFDEKE